MSNYAPNTARIKDDYRRSRVWESGNGSEAYEKEFDRWHAAEIAAAEQRGAAKALRDAADEFIPRVPLPRSHRDNQQDVQGWLNRRADRLETRNA